MNSIDSETAKNQSFMARRMMETLVVFLHESTREASDPKAQALFETSAEVLQGVIKAFQHFENKSEEAWR
ncbi:MAG: hypothetical protein JNN07_16970 [Verrucomicrobiales bacterium]|jgi:hypothetical protein|nr:hypothetical protein [Verrucomicrobiales bacterium]